MTTFTFTSPEGKEYDIEGPEGATQEQAFAILQQHLGASPAPDTRAKTDPDAPVAKLNKAISDRMPDFVNSLVEAVGQPASGVLEGVAGMLNLPGDVVRAVGERLGVAPDKLPMRTQEITDAGIEAGVTAEESDSATGRISRRVGREVGGGMTAAAPILKAADLGLKGARGFQSAVAAARGGPVGLVADAVGIKTAPAAFAAGEATASATAGLGAGIAQEIAPGSTAAEITGLLLGAVAPSATAGSVRRLVRGGEGTRQAMQKSVEEFAEAGVTPTVGMATRRRFNEAVESGLSILPGSSGRMAVYAEKTARELYDRVDNVTAGLAPLRSADTAGVAIKKGIAGYVQNFKDKWRTLDAQVAKAVQPTDRIKMTNTRGAMIEMMDPGTVTSYPELTAFVQRLDDLSRGGLMTYKDLRTFRTSVGALIPEAYARDLPKGKLSAIYEALAQDLRVHLKTRAYSSVSRAKSQVADKALASLERSDKYYKAAMKRLDESLAPLTSHDIPERVFLALERSGHAGRTVINAAKRSIGKDNWDVVAGTIFQRMGKAPAGAQNAATDVFSAGTFLTNWTKYGQNRGALEALLQGTSGGTQFVKDMNAVAKVAERIREAGRVFSNPSGTARAIANVGLGTTVATSVLTGNLKSAGVVLGVATGANLSARAFTNPKFVRFLARSTEVPVARMPALIARLGASLAGEPEDVQIEIATFLDRLSDEFSARDAAR